MISLLHRLTTVLSLGISFRRTSLAFIEQWARGSGHFGWLCAAIGLSLACRDQPPLHDVPLTWQFERIWSVGGGDEGRLSLGQVEPFQVGFANRQIYLLDRASFRVFILTLDGRVTDTLGGQGLGPGEFVAPWAIGLDDSGAVGVVDMGTRRIVRWSAGGKLLAPTSIEGVIEHPKVAFVGPDRVMNMWSLDSVREYQLVSIGPTGRRVLGRLARAPLHIADLPSCSATRISLTPLFMPAIHWDINGDRLAVSTGAEYSVQLFVGGKMGLTVSRAIVPERGTQANAEAEAVNWRFNDCLVPPAEVVGATGFQESIPIVLSVALSPGGELWVQRRTGRRGRPATDLFDSGGVYLGTLPGPSPFPAVFVGTDSVLAVENDSNDVSMVSLFRIRRQPAQ